MEVRILHVSDIHCDTHRLVKVLEQEVYDFVVATGDFECVDTAEALLDKAKAPLYAVTGNMDDPSVARVLRDAGVLLDGRIATARGLTLAGVGGLDAAGSLTALKRKLGDTGGVDLLLSHHPPRGVLDKTFIGLRIGLREIRSLVAELRPRAHLFGHVHESRGMLELDGTLFVNAGPLMRGYYAVVVVEDGSWRAKLLHTH